MAIFLPENQALNTNAYNMPKDLKNHLATSFIANSQYSQNPGYKKALHLCDPSYNDRSKGKSTQGKNGIPYSSLKKIKHTFDYSDPKSLEYNLLGGEKMQHWVNDTLNRERSKVKPELERKKSEALKNNTKPSKPTKNTVKSGDVKVTIKEEYEHKYLDMLEDYDAGNIFRMFLNKEKPWVNLINPTAYHKALQEFTKFGSLIHFPINKIYQWFGIVMRNTAILSTLTSIAGHGNYLPMDEFLDAFFYNYEEGDIDYDAWNKYKEEHDYDEDYGAMIEYLDELEFFEWFQLPDGSDPWTDSGLEPLEKIISDYNDNLSPEKVLVLLNKALDIIHQRGDLSSIFIQGGKNALSQISEEILKTNKKIIHLTENQLKTLKEKLK